VNYGAVPLRSTRRLANLAGGKSGLLPWYRIANSAAGLPTQVSIYDEIGIYGVPAGEFMADLAGVNGDIELHINSPGGDVHGGIAIYNQLKQRAGQVHVIIDGLAASAASFVAQAASPGRLEIAPHAQMMIHNGFSMGIGDAADMRKLADLLDTLTGEIAAIYAERTGKPQSYWLAQMAAETWYTDKQAVADRLADKIHGTDDEPSGSWDLSVFSRYSASGSGGNGGWVRRDGKWVFDPDGDGDDDATPSGDADHDYWSADGTQLKAIPPDPDGKQGKPLPGNTAPQPVLNADTSAWDGSRAMANGAASDDPAKFYAGICAGRKAGDPDKQGSWALPYKYHPGDAPNAAGVKAALSRISQTDGLTNKAEAQALLERLMKQVSPDHEPDNSIDPGLLASVFALALSEGGPR
jgi:ATP-dependent Clp endopeptidase proteolytic subunit ClpP